MGGEPSGEAGKPGLPWTRPGDRAPACLSALPKSHLPAAPAAAVKVPKREGDWRRFLFPSQPAGLGPDRGGGAGDPGLGAPLERRGAQQRRAPPGSPSPRPNLARGACALGEPLSLR